MAIYTSLLNILDLLSKPGVREEMTDAYNKGKEKMPDKGVSLVKYIKDSIITSRVYIQQELADEVILKDVLNNLYNMYTGYILTALQMNRYVENGKKVKDFIKVVSTEDYRDALEIASESFNLTMVSDKDKKDQGANVKRAIVDLPSNVSLPTGRLLSIDFAGGDDGKSKVTVNLTVQLFPNFITSDVAEQFVTLNFSPATMQRLRQVSAGEISFWKDFLMQRDVLTKRKKAMLADKSGVLADMLIRQTNALDTSLQKQAGLSAHKDKQNIANTILIFDKQQFLRFCNESNVKWAKSNNVVENVVDRQVFFDRTFSMIVVLIDTMFNRVEFYFNGIDHAGEYTYSQLKSNSSKDNIDIVDIMSKLAQGMAPKF